jgi:hypothetical protein
MKATNTETTEEKNKQLLEATAIYQNNLKDAKQVEEIIREKENNLEEARQKENNLEKIREVREIEEIIRFNKNKLVEITRQNENHLEEAKQVLAKMSYQDATYRDSHNSPTEFHHAIMRGDEVLCKLFIERFPSIVNAADYTPLFYAILRGQVEVCKLLIEACPSIVNAAGKTSNTPKPLYDAIMRDQLEVCKILMETDPSIVNDFVNFDLGIKSIFISMLNMDSEITKVLICNTNMGTNIKLLKQNIKDLPDFAKATSKVAADFMKDKFLTDNNPKFSYGEVRLLKLHQLIDKTLLETHFTKENINKCFSDANTYIVKHYFKLIGVCKTVNADSPMSILIAHDCLPGVLSHLEPHSLCPGAFDPEVKALGEAEVISS